jgi:hypothetical protein
MKIDISDEIYAVLASRAKAKGFGSETEYIESLLKQIAEKIKNEKAPGAEYSADDRQKIEGRLRSLGYID